MMQKLDYSDKKEKSFILKRPVQSYKAIERTVNHIFKDIQLFGDIAVKKYAEKYDKVILDSFEVSVEEIETAKKMVSSELKSAIQLAKTNIEKFHKAQITKPVQIETSQGVICWQEKRAIEKVGLYIPGGTAPLFSTVLMLAVPAMIAGCNEIILCTPTNKMGLIHPAVLYTANLCGISKITKVGGIQAVAAMTFGTESIPKVFKIFGPGNQFVTVAKQMATSYNVAIDLPAGASELLIFADETANASFVASDLLSQAEHGVDSQVILVSKSKILIKEVESEINKQINKLPRKEIAKKAILNSKLIYCESDINALELINDYAPEHLIICVKSENEILDQIQNAGSVFIGNYSPESAGDYVAGTNHTLPTNAYAKNYSGVNLDSFLKVISFQKISKRGLKGIGSAIEEMADAEGLFAHKNAVSLRLKTLENEK
jgi:histidinol dehydrogenase